MQPFPGAQSPREKKGSKKKSLKTGRKEQLIKMGGKKIKSFYKEVKKIVSMSVKSVRGLV